MEALYDTHNLVARAGGGTADPNRPPVYKAVGLCLAIASGLFIGVSFVMKKVGLLKANDKYNEVAGEGYGYLKNYWWWGGMTLMIVGEICNFVAYAFVDAILVTPLGALSVVVTTILSAIFLKERLSFVGKVGCFNCIIGSVVIVLNAPEQSAVADIQQMKHYVIAPGFLSYAGVVILVCLFLALWAGPRYGKKTMLVYLTICSLIGGLSVVATQGLGSAIVAQAGGKPQFNQWFLYLLLVFVIATLLTEIIYLNKALNLFNAALVTPTYYVIFTSATIVTSAILFRGFKGTPISIATVIMGFLQICSGVVLLQLSKSSKDVPDAAVFKGDLDQIREVAEQEQPETEPKADAIRGAAALVRRISSARQKMEEKEFERLHQEKIQDHLEPVRENEVVEWDGLRRRKTVIGDHPNSPIVRRKTMHPPLGMSQMPDEDADENDPERNSHGSVLASFRDRASTMLHLPRHSSPRPAHSTIRPVALEEIEVHATKQDDSVPEPSEGLEVPHEHNLGLPADLRKSRKQLWSPRSKPLPPNPETPPLTARRQFSFTNFMARNKTPANDGSGDNRPPTRADIASRGSNYSPEQKRALKTATEEERLGLVKGESARALFKSSPESRYALYPIISHSRSLSASSSQSSASSQDHKHHHHGRSPSQHAQPVLTSDADWQTTNRPAFDTTTVTATVARETKISRPEPSRTQSNFERPPRSLTDPRQILSPPPSYQQAQQTHPEARPVAPQMAQVDRNPILSPRTAPVTAPRSVSHGHGLAPVSAREAPASVLSPTLLTSQSRTRGHTSTFSSSNERKTTTIDESDADEFETSSSTDIDDDASYRPQTSYAQMNQAYARSASSPVRLNGSRPLHASEAGRVTARSPEISDPSAAETKGRFHEQSRREREKRRLRMSSGAGPGPSD